MKKYSRRLAEFLCVLGLFCTAGAVGQDRAGWMREARWGVMTHYLADWRARTDGLEMSVKVWNEMIDQFDVNGLAEQLESVGAGYYLITIGQNSGYYLSPNGAYDRLVGILPSRCSGRDLVADLHTALQERKIRLMIYLPSGAPNADPVAVEQLEWRNGPYPNREFQSKWEQVIFEWSERWGSKVSGWWFDGCYWPNTMYRSPQAPNFESLAAAARSGNPDSAVAFNPGIVYRTISVTPHEDYIGGEINDLNLLSIRRVYDGKVDGAQLHTLSYLGETWGMGAPRFTSDEVVKWTREVVENGGAMTWDVPVQLNGLMAQPFIDRLKAIGPPLESESSENSLQP